MTGLPTVPDTTGHQVVDSLGLGRSTGTTAQNWAGPVMDADSSALQNSYGAVAAGDPNPQDTRPGYLAAGQPGGANADALVPGGQYDSDNQVQTLGSPAGTGGGGGQYPNITGTDGVPDPMLAPGWTAQAKADEDLSEVRVVVSTEYGFAHGTAQTITPTISGGTTPYTVTTVEDDGISEAALPTGFSLASATGVLTLSTGTQAGTYTLGFRVVDSSSPAQYATYEIPVVLS